MTRTESVRAFWRRLTLKHFVWAAVGIALLVGSAWFYRRIDMAALHERAQGMNGFSVVAALTLLPMVGFPVSVLHAIAGVRFGVGWGLVWVGVSVVVQMVLSYYLVHLAPGFFAKKFEPLRKRLPVAAHRALTLFVLLVPGVPYFAQNYILPLVGVPLGMYLAWGVPIHFLRSVVGVIFGEMSDELTPWRIAGFALYAVSITAVCGWAFRRLQKEMRYPRSVANDPKPPA